MAEREEVARQNVSLIKDLTAAGLIFNEVDPAPFQETLSKAGFYSEWRSKFGDDAWGMLEEAVGKLA